MKSKLAIFVALSGWAILISYIFYDYAEYGFQVMEHFFSAKNVFETFFHLLILSVPIGSTIIGYLINERKKLLEKTQLSEKKYRNLIDTALIGVYKTNLKGDVIYVNETLSNIFEFTSSEEMMQSSVLPWYKNPEDREVLIEKLKETGKVNNFEFEGLTKTGKTKNILLSATLDGDILSGMIMEITESHGLKNVLMQRVKELEEFYDIAIGRELKMVELKEEVEKLKKELRRHNT